MQSGYKVIAETPSLATFHYFPELPLKLQVRILEDVTDPQLNRGISTGLIAGLAEDAARESRFPTLYSLLHKKYILRLSLQYKQESGWHVSLVKVDSS